MTLFVITGANGFIGRHLLASLVADGKRVRALTRTKSRAECNLNGVEWIVGDIADPATWNVLLEKNCIVVNLAYSHTLATSTALQGMAEMIEACAYVKIAHLIHISTVSVYGRVVETILTEESVCNPLGAYGKIKLLLEGVLTYGAKGRFPVTIIRPAAVFGEGGETLNKLLGELLENPRFINYLRSSLFGHRRTHLVPVETVVSAISFICDIPPPATNEIFIVSDADPLNNFNSVEQVFMNEMKLPPYCIPRVPVPRLLLEASLIIMRRPTFNTLTEYSSDKLASLGFVKPVSLNSALLRFVKSYQAQSNSAT
jgi:nucleoside-diphosphate-sugar epimerase